jgi:hypothetical protein
LATVRLDEQGTEVSVSGYRGESEAVARVGAAALLCVALVAVLGCGGDRTDGLTRTLDPSLATPDRSVVSPSGDYRLEVVEGEYRGEEGSGPWWRIRIRDRDGDGEIILDSRERFAIRFKTLVLWDDRLDRAWVYSSDVGTGYWDREDDGNWSYDGFDPENGKPPVPRLLVEEYPERFGREGRASAAENLRTQGPDPQPPGAGISEDDPRIMKPR